MVKRPSQREWRRRTVGVPMPLGIVPPWSVQPAPVGGHPALAKTPTDQGLPQLAPPSSYQLEGRALEPGPLLRMSRTPQDNASEAERTATYLTSCAVAATAAAPPASRHVADRRAPKPLSVRPLSVTPSTGPSGLLEPVFSDLGRTPAETDELAIDQLAPTNQLRASWKPLGSAVRWPGSYRCTETRSTVTT